MPSLQFWILMVDFIPLFDQGGSWLFAPVSFGESPDSLSRNNLNAFIIKLNTFMIKYIIISLQWKLDQSCEKLDQNLSAG